MEGVDYSAARPSVAVLKAAGKKFVCRYLAPIGKSGDWKRISLAEANALRKGGMGIVLVWEAGANRALSGFAAGAADAKEAARQAKLLGFPINRPIHFAVDFDAAPKQRQALVPYFKGVNSVIGVNRTGCYSGYWPLVTLFGAGVIKYGWQTYAWSGGNVHPKATLLQYSNGQRVGTSSVDLDRALKADYGNARSLVITPAPPSPKPVPAPKPKPSPLFNILVSKIKGKYVTKIVPLPSGKP